MKPRVREAAPEHLLVRWSSLWGTLWLIGFGLFFYSFTLPNNSHITRLDIWLALPELIAGNLFPEQSADHGWSFLLERIPVALASGIIVLTALALGRLLLRSLRLCSEMDFSTRL
ncbi:MAG: hypothetical protein KDA90_22040, partial [Planctomycetaceae bacterium]|nr:hypothetical protein [Planctomycetaceae bacterium]